MVFHGSANVWIAGEDIITVRPGTFTAFSSTRPARSISRQAGRACSAAIMRRAGRDVTPSFTGNIWGIQVGLPVLALEHASGEKDRAGFFFGYSAVTGVVTGFSIGQLNQPVGTLGVNSSSLGGYWTHFWPAGDYVDAVMMNSWLTDLTQSATSTAGRILTTSLELGYPIPLPAGLAIEPQAQFIYQHQGFDLAFDPFSQISFAQSDVFIGRFGVRLVGNFVGDKAMFRPFLMTNLWHDFGGQHGCLQCNANRYQPQRDRDRSRRWRVSFDGQVGRRLRQGELHHGHRWQYAELGQWQARLLLGLVTL
jgi:outer membrane autotransporter protein